MAALLSPSTSAAAARFQRTVDPLVRQHDSWNTTQSLSVQGCVWACRREQPVMLQKWMNQRQMCPPTNWSWLLYIRKAQILAFGFKLNLSRWMKYFVLKCVLRNLKTGKIKIAKWSAQRYRNGKERTNCLQAHNCAPLFTCGRRPQTWNEYECSHAVLQIMKYHNNAISRLLQQSAALTSMGLQIFFKDVYMYIRIYICRGGHAYT